ncbi:flagellar protein FlaA [Yersinia enterocolitica]|uniref:flagellin N-terminal helical domain-containing protein n=1 Tax=Yersinia enterocolitica TaxID=630 RepID=UPI000327E12B|nr:flagellin [Yersinia enterocolitica]AOF13787.1 flagellar protein FlaA [Yersinia enterocolitica]AOF17897.1 flagellar protein FlaA [Yersinia enterocolitica]AOF22429.1 flagellar protein FlaA [Yersinia enterocolitica]AOF26140.1 flagellar protein FlaA [Yersinia enterocolitica]AOF30251.1 flagellar protein FlaA [Yersinia enterocolitica]
MGLSINDQSQAFIAAKALNKSQNMYNKSTSQLSTGLRILSAKDDAAGSQIAAGLNAAITGQNVALRNNSQSSAMLEAANGALAGSDGILNRMKELATQAANATNGAEDRAALNAEFKSLGEELQSTLEKTTFGDGTLFAAGGKLDGRLTFQTGASATDVIEIDLSKGVKGLMETVAGKATVGDKSAPANTIENIVGLAEEAIATKAGDVTVAEGNVKVAENTFQSGYVTAKLTTPTLTEDAYGKQLTADSFTEVKAKALGLKWITTGTPAQGEVDSNTKISHRQVVELVEKTVDTAKIAKADADSALQNIKDNDSRYRSEGIALLSLDDTAKAQEAITTLTKAIGSYSSVTASLAAGINRLGYSSDNLTNMRDGNMAAKDSIMNADAVAASTAQNTAMLLMNSGIKALSKNTQMGQMVAQLF